MNRLTATFPRRVTAPKLDATAIQLLLSVAGVVFLGASLWKLSTLELSTSEFVLGMVLSLAVTLLLVVSGLAIGARQDSAE